MKKQDVYQHILQVAESFIQTKGYNAFSYKDIAEMVGVKTSSIHYYFPTKADLGKEVVKIHIDALCQQLDWIVNKKNISCRKKLEQLIDSIVAKTYLDDRKMCLGGMLAVDVLTLPSPIQKEVRFFFSRLEQILSQLLADGVYKKEFHIEEKNIKNEAIYILSLTEGALLLARLYQDDTYLLNAKKQMISRFSKS